MQWNRGTKIQRIVNMGARSATSSGGTDKDGIENVVNNRFGGNRESKQNLLIH